MNQHTVYFLDFDHTLFDTDRFFHVDVQERLLALGVDAELWRSTYDAVRLSGYTLEKHMAVIARQPGRQLSPHITQEIIAEFSDLRRYLFPDAVSFLQSFDPLHTHLAILSFGNPDWQRFKVRASGIEPFFQNLFFTGAEYSKADVVRSCAARYGEIVAIDNHPGELDAIRDAVPSARTFLINRVPEEKVLAELPGNSFLEAKKYLDIPFRHHHTPCVTLQK